MCNAQGSPVNHPRHQSSASIPHVGWCFQSLTLLIISTAMSYSMRSLFQQLFSGLLKKKGGKKKRIFPYPKGSAVTLQAFDSGVLKDPMISVYILLNTYSNIFYRHTAVQFYDRCKMLKGQRNQQNNSICLLSWEISRSWVIQTSLKKSARNNQSKHSLKSEVFDCVKIGENTEPRFSALWL